MLYCGGSVSKEIKMNIEVLE